MTPPFPNRPNVETSHIALKLFKCWDTQIFAEETLPAGPLLTEDLERPSGPVLRRLRAALRRGLQQDAGLAHPGAPCWGHAGEHSPLLLFAADNEKVKMRCINA